MTAATTAPPPGLFLVGTDTGVGKTTLARALLRYANRNGFRLIPFKPVETGCPEGVPLDASALLEAAAVPGLALSEVCPHPLRAPLAPTVAARLEGLPPLDEADLATRARHLATRGSAILIEGAGGFRTPWARGVNAATLAARLGIRIVVVAANRLGVINHATLVAAECHRRQLACSGFVLVDVTPDPSPDRPHNSAEIEAETGLRPLGTLRHLPDADADLLANCAAADLDLDALLGVRLR